MSRVGLAGLVLAMLLWLQGCGSGFAPVTDQSLGARSGSSVTSLASPSATTNRPTPLPNPGTYRVVRGDTLYSISWRYGLDYRQVAIWNGIDQRYQILAGQTLRLTPPGTTSTSSVAMTSQATQQSTSSGTSQPTSQSNSQTNTQTSTQVRTTAPATAPQSVAQVGNLTWRWPAQGPIIGRFSAQAGGNKGIDIAGKEGDPIYAAAPGRVVYAGSGLLGYGNLVIINHNQQFLSAYAHNSRILVSENDMVKSGDKIAEMGQTGADRVQLHFEIRRDGKPVDPMLYLPKR